MQVSWIEPDEVRALAALLHGTTSTGTGGGWDVQTLPDAQSRPLPLLPQGPEPGGNSATPASLPVPPEAQPPSPNTDVVLIREKLRIIRDRAKQAGLIQDEPPPVPAAPAPSAPLDAPMAPPAPPPLSQLPPLASLRPETASSAPPPAPLPAPAPAPPSAPALPPTEAQVDAASSSAPDSAPAFLPLEGPLTERLENFARWASKLTGSTEVLLVDDHGDMLWGAPSDSSLIVAAMLAVHQALRASAGSLHLPPNMLQITVGDLGPVEVLPCSTRFGLVTVILVNTPPPSEAAAAALREALVLSVEAGGS